MKNENIYAHHNTSTGIFFIRNIELDSANV